MLYLCLEDSYSRIQNRLLDITDDAPPNLFFATMSEKLHSGLEQQIKRFLAELRLLLRSTKLVSVAPLIPVVPEIMFMGSSSFIFRRW